MTDTSLTDLAPFFERYDRRNRFVFVATFSASLMLGAVVATRLLTTGWAGSTPAVMMWVFGTGFTPLMLCVWWSFGEIMARGRRRTLQADGRHPAGPDDARNGVRVANAGFVYSLGVSAAVLAQQAFWALIAFGYPVGDLIPRVTTMAIGAVTIYLGNLWPRMPISRAPGERAAMRMKANRVIGWVMVVIGLLVVLLGLFLPLLYPWMRRHA
jgi:hypothetical protein